MHHEKIEHCPDFDRFVPWRFFIFADFLGFGGDRGIGAAQILGILVSITIILLGIGLMTVRWDKEKEEKERIHFIKFTNIPILFWVLATFLFVYVSFFLQPVFLSKIQIQYPTNYIPNAFITHIGFDIETIVSRIEIWLKTGQSPYTDGVIAYPPLAIVIFATFSIIGYPAYFKLITSITLFLILLQL